jgi:hypothetical protein
LQVQHATCTTQPAPCSVATRYAAFHIPFEWAAISDIKRASLDVALNAISAVLAERERRKGAADPILHKQLQVPPRRGESQ